MQTPGARTPARTRARTGASRPARTPARRPARFWLLLLLGATLLTACGQDGGAAAPAPRDPGTSSGPSGPDSPAATAGPTAPAATTAPPTTEDTMDPRDLLPDRSVAPPTLPGAVLPDAAAGADLVLVAGPDGAEQPPLTLVCDFSAGTASGGHPDVEAACADLRSALQGGDPFAPVPPDAACTMQYGGDGVVRLSGTVRGEDGATVPVEARYALDDGCEIARWERLGAVLSPYRGGV